MKQEKHIYIVIVENVIWTPHKTHKIYLNLNYSSKIDAHMHASSMPYDSIEHKYNKKAIDFLVSFLRFFCAFRLLLFRFSSSHSNKKWMKCFHNIIFMYINRFSFKFFLQLSRRFLLQNSLVVCVSQCEHKWWYTLYVRRVYIHVHYIFRFFILLFDNKKKCTKLCVCCWRLYFIWSLMCASMWWEMNSLERIDERFSLFFWRYYCCCCRYSTMYITYYVQYSFSKDSLTHAEKIVSNFFFFRFSQQRAKLC